MRIGHRSSTIAAATLGIGLMFAGSSAIRTNAQNPGTTVPEVNPATLQPLPEHAGDGDYAIGPDFQKAPEDSARDGVPKGMIYRFTMDSTDSKIYSGIAKNRPGEVVPYHRRVSVYVPAEYKAGKPAPLIVSQDSMGSGGNLLPTVLDNLIADHKLPAIVAVMIDSGGGDAQGSERGLEYDTVSGKYAEFIEREVLPKVSEDYKVTFTKDPEGRATMGGSSGAACAFTMAWFHPDLYRRVLSYSGTFVDQQSPKNPASPHGAWEYHENLIPKSERRPIRIWMQVGETDNGYKKDEASLHNWVMANDRMAAALKAKGYHYRYVFSAGAGHVDGRVVRQTLPEAMLWLWQGYPIK